MWPFPEWPWPQRSREEGGLLRCSFCGKSQNDVRKLIAGPRVYICDRCIDLCNDILTDERGEELKSAEAEARPDGSPRPAGVAVCRLCGLPASMDCVAMIPDRGFLCLVCLDAIRAASEPNDGQ